MRKRTMLAVLFASMLLTACAGNKEEVTVLKAVNESAEGSAENEAAGAENSAENEAAGAENGIKKETVEPERVEHSDTGNPGSYEKGTVTENGWESRWLGIRYSAPEKATMVTEEELDEIMVLGQEVLFEDFDRLELEYTKIPMVYEMMCIGEDGVTTVMITVERLPISADAETYFTSFKEQLKETSSMTYKVINNDGVTLIGDKEFQVLKCLVSYNGIELYQDYYVMIVGERVVNLVVTYKEEDGIEEILKGFTVYK